MHQFPEGSSTTITTPVPPCVTPTTPPEGNTPLNGQCINQDSADIETICQNLVYECACGNSPANDTMYNYCVNVIFSSQEVCRAIVTEGTGATPFNTCVANPGNSPVTDFVCGQACTCCALDVSDPNCFEKCKQSAFFHQMGETCAAAQGTCQWQS